MYPAQSRFTRRSIHTRLTLRDILIRVIIVL